MRRCGPLVGGHLRLGTNRPEGNSVQMSRTTATAAAVNPPPGCSGRSAECGVCARASQSFFSASTFDLLFHFYKIRTQKVTGQERAQMRERDFAICLERLPECRRGALLNASCDRSLTYVIREP